MKYLLSTGQGTTKLEYYIIDLFKLYLSIWPSDIPGAPDIGFDFILTDIKKANLVREVTYRVNTLIDKIKDKFPRTLEISVESIELLDETKVKIIINVNEVRSQDITIDINETR